MLVFILDSGVSVSLTFGLVGFYFGLGHFSLVEFWSIQVFCDETAIFGLRYFFCSLLSLFLRGMLHLGYAGFISSSC